MFVKDQHELKNLTIWLKYQHISKYHWPVAHVQHEQIQGEKLCVELQTRTWCWSAIKVQSLEPLKSEQPNSHAKL